MPPYRLIRTSKFTFTRSHFLQFTDQHHVSIVTGVGILAQTQHPLTHLHTKCMYAFCFSISVYFLVSITKFN